MFRKLVYLLLTVVLICTVIVGSGCTSSMYTAAPKKTLDPTPTMYRVTYIVEGDAIFGIPGGGKAPKDENSPYNWNEKVTVKNDLKTTWTTSDGTTTGIPGTWTFSSWDRDDFEIQRDTVISGSWTFTPDTFDVYFDIYSKWNLLFNKYDIEIYIDDREIGTVSNGNRFQKLENIVAGKHTFYAYKVGDHSVLGTKTLNVYGEMTFKCDLDHSSYSIDLINIDMFDSVPTPTPKPTPTPTPKPTIIPNDARYHSSHDSSVAKKGNTGVYSYVSSKTSYDIYYIIDFDEGYVYRFIEGNGDDSCDKVQMESGDLNSVLIITYYDGDEKWSYGLNFKWKNQPDNILFLQEQNGKTYEYIPTDLEKAIILRNTKRIIDYSKKSSESNTPKETPKPSETPIIQRDAFEKMKQYAIKNGDNTGTTYNAEIGRSYSSDGSLMLRVLSYNKNDKSLTLAVNYKTYTGGLFFDKISGSYTWAIVDTSNGYRMVGSVSAKSFRSYSILDYNVTNFSGVTAKNTYQELATSMLVYLLSHLNNDLSSTGVTIQDLGFINF